MSVDIATAIRSCCEALAKGRMSIADGAAVIAREFGGRAGLSDEEFEASSRLVTELMPLPRLLVLIQILRRRSHFSLGHRLALSGLERHANRRELRMEQAACLSAAGDVDAAVAIYESLAAEADAEGNALDAALDALIGQKRLRDAESLLARWIPANPARAEEFPALMTRCKLAAVRRDHPAVIRLSSAAVALQPTALLPRVRLATAHMARLEFEPARATLLEALKFSPTDVDALILSAACARALGRNDEARDHFLTLARFHPANPRFIAIMGEWLPSADSSAFDDIVAAVKAADVAPRDRDFVLAALAYENGDAEQAIAAIDEIAGRYPDGVNAQEASVLAKSLVSLRRPTEAIAVLEQQLATPSANTLRDYMNALMSAGMYTAATDVPARFPAQFETDYLQFMTAHAQLNARLGQRGSDGWWREFRMSPHTKLLRSGRTELNYDPDILTFREAASAAVLPAYGVGDELRFASIYRDILRDCTDVTFLCDPRLASLFSRSFPGAQFIGAKRRESTAYTPAIVAWARGLPDAELARLMDHAAYEKVRTFDNVILVADLLEHYRPDSSHFEERTPYLVSDPKRVADAARLMASASDGPKIGLTWRSSLLRTSRLANYTSLDAWGDVFAIPGGTFYSFQHDATEAEIAAAEQKFGIEIRRFPGIDLRDDFETVAGLLLNLDILVGPAVASLEFAAALGVEVAMMWRVPNGRYRQHPDGRDLWHRSMKPIFGEPLGDEASMFAAVARHINEITPRGVQP